MHLLQKLVLLSGWQMFEIFYAALMNFDLLINYYSIDRYVYYIYTYMLELRKQFPDTVILFSCRLLNRYEAQIKKCLNYFQGLRKKQLERRRVPEWVPQL